MAKTGKQKADPKIRVMLVDDHPIVRQGISLLIAQEPDMEVCAEAEGVAEALEAIGRTRPNVVVVDLTLKEGLGLELIKDVKVRYPKVLAMVYSMRDETFYAERVLRAGARGYVTKEEGGQTVIEAIRKVLAGQIFLSDAMASKMIGQFVGGPTDAPVDSIHNLTDRELEVFELIGLGLPTREIAQRLHLSPKTVDSHREHIKEKLQIDNATDLLKHAIEWAAFRKSQ
jgi:DNA-binding NarL/FixJ family response regulator